MDLKLHTPHTLLTLALLVGAAFRALGAPIADPIPEPIATGPIQVQLGTVATGLTAPNKGVAAPGLPDRLFVTDQDGVIWNVDTVSGTKTTFANFSGRVVSLGVAGPGTFDERGLLGIAFHPNYQTNGLVYTYTSEPVAGPADFSTMPAGETANHQSVINEWQVPDPTSASSVIDPATQREVLRIDQPQFNHNGGDLGFGPDGNLFISLGDGGAADDQGVGHVPGGNGQDPTNPLGAVLRIDPLGNNSTNGQYGIPTDNPFVSDSNLDEIYAYGMRNPFRFSFDSDTGDLLLGDVGQNDIEEINIVTAGGNYGWNTKEGTFLFDPNGTDPGFVFMNSPGAPAGLTDPVLQYDHDEGIAVVGGFIYRGSALSSTLAGKYIFGDFFNPAQGSGRLFMGDLATGVIDELRIEGMPSGLGLSVLGFGQDASGELYVLGNQTGTPFGDTGVVARLVAANRVPEPAMATLLLLGLGPLFLFFARSTWRHLN